MMTLETHIGCDGTGHVDLPRDSTTAGVTFIEGVAVDGVTGRVLSSAAGALPPQGVADRADDPAASEAAGEASGRNPAGGGVTASTPPVPERPATPGQRLALSKQIAVLDGRLSSDYLAWCRAAGVPAQPSDCTFDQARRALIFVGDKANSEAE